MKSIATACLAIWALTWAGAASAGIIDASEFADDTEFSDLTGAVSLTGALPNIGAQGTSVTLGGASLSAADTIFVGSGWSSLLPDGNAIAISDRENLQISISTGLATAFGFYFHEPTTDGERLDGCNATCFDSEFEIAFLLGGVLVDSTPFFPPDDRAFFGGIILDEVFDEVRFTEVEGGIDNEFFGEMYVVRVSEPATLLLFGGALVGLGLRRRRIAP